MSDPDPYELTQAQHGLIGSLFAGLPNDFDACRAAVVAIRQGFQSELARQVEPSLNARIRTLPQSTLVDRQELATWVNRTLRELNLKIRAPNGTPAILLADTHTPDDPDRGARFRLACYNASGRPLRAAPTYGALFDLALMPAPERVEGLSRAGRDRRQPGDGRGHR